VVDCFKRYGSLPLFNSFRKYNSLICKFTVSFKSSILTKTSHYSEHQEKLYNEVKRLKEVEGLGYIEQSLDIHKKIFQKK